MADQRVIVRKFPAVDLERPWFAFLGTGMDDEDSVQVGRFASHAEAVTRGITALRFVSVGIPWREK